MKTEKAYPERRLRGVLEELSTGCKCVCINLLKPHFNSDGVIEISVSLIIVPFLTLCFFSFFFYGFWVGVVCVCGGSVMWHNNYNI